MLKNKLLIFTLFSSATLTSCFANKVKEVISFKENLNTKYDTVLKEAKLLGSDFTSSNDKFQRYQETLTKNNEFWSELEKSKEKDVTCTYYSLDEKWQILKNVKKTKKDDCVKIFEKQYTSLDSNLKEVEKEIETHRKDVFDEYVDFMEKTGDTFSKELKTKYENLKAKEKNYTGLVEKILYESATKAFEAIVNSKLLENIDSSIEKIKAKDPLYVLYKEAKFVHDPFSTPPGKEFWRIDKIKTKWKDGIEAIKDSFKRIDDLAK